MTEQEYQSDQQERYHDPLKVEFPRSIGQKEARKICKDLIFRLEGDCLIDLHTEKNERFGERLYKVNLVGPEDVRVTKGIAVKLSGRIMKSYELTSLEFSFLVDYQNRIDRTSYSGLILHHGVDSFDEMPEEAQELLQQVRGAIDDYFKKR